MQLKPMYRVRFMYPEAWSVNLTGPDGTMSQHFMFAEGQCAGRITGRFRGANHPQRRTDGTFQPDFQRIIETVDGGTILFDIRGYGRTYPVGRRQVVSSITHLSDDERYQWLNDVVCVATGEVRTPTGEREAMAAGKSTIKPIAELVLDVAELIWEPIPE